LERFLRIPIAQEGQTSPFTYTSEILDDSNKVSFAAANLTSGRASSLSSFANKKDEVNATNNEESNIDFIFIGLI
jgi:hypothetical protein